MRKDIRSTRSILSRSVTAAVASLAAAGSQGLYAQDPVEVVNQLEEIVVT